MTTLTLLASIVAAAIPLAAVQNPRGGTASPFFCNLKALTTSERVDHEQLTMRLAQATRTTSEMPDGYAFELDASHISMLDLARWSEFERRCCPFFDFHLEARRESGPLTLRLTGRDGVKEFIRVEFAKAFR
jgi:hypothetical protein